MKTLSKPPIIADPLLAELYEDIHFYNEQPPQANIWPFTYPEPEEEQSEPQVSELLVVALRIAIGVLLVCSAVWKVFSWVKK